MRILKLLAIVSFIAGLGYSQTVSTVYDPTVKKITEQKISTKSIIPYNVGKSTIGISISDKDRQLNVWNLSTTMTIFYGYTPFISTCSYASVGSLIVNTSSATIPILPGNYMKFEKLYGMIYIVNEALSQSSSPVAVERFTLTK